MVTFNEFTLGNAANKYIEQYLSSGKTLSKELRKILRLNDGNITTYMPDYLGLGQINQFEAGLLHPPPKLEWARNEGDVPIPISSMRFNLISQLNSYLNQNSDRLCVLENYMSRPTDKGLETAESHVVFYKDEVYHVLGHQADKQAIETALNEGEWLPIFVGIMTHLPDGMHIPKSGTFITEKELVQLAERTVGIVVGAYDGEGYLIWRSHKKK
jgi:hypothetical protein